VNRNVREVNASLRALAAKNGVTLLDIERALDDGAGFRRAEFAREDGSHLTPAAYAEMTRVTSAHLARAPRS
jgi:hypothetical protein